MKAWFKAALALVGAVILGQRAVLFAAEPSDISVTVEDTGDAVRLRVSPPTPEMIRMYVLGEPNRVVIDITGSFVAPRQDLIPIPNPLVTAVRFGTHPGKTRVVADIKTSEVPTPSIVGTDGGVMIVLPVAAETRAAFVAKTVGGSVIATVPLVAAAEQGKEPAPPVGQRLSELTFDRHPGDGAPIVRLGLTERPSYSFQKADAKTYRITLQNCTIGGAQLAFPQYPPDDFNGFTIVEVRQAGANTEVLVGVDRDFKIAPTSTENAILIRAVPRG